MTHIHSSIRAKMRVFKDFGIPWDDAITEKFNERLAKRQSLGLPTDPDIIADTVCHDIIARTLNERGYDVD